MTTTTAEAPTAPVILAASSDPTPVEKTVVTGLIEDFDPETLLSIVFARPSGGLHQWHAWTTGGAPLGDQVDRDAVAAGFDSVDWLFTPGRYVTERTRGRVTIYAYPLRPIHADVLTGQRAGRSDRAKAQEFLRRYASRTGGPAPEDCDPDYAGPWLGVGPALIDKYRSAR
jgi:hypothetical protein